MLPYPKTKAGNKINIKDKIGHFRFPQPYTFQT